MIAIIKYNAGNSTSVKNALKRLGFESVITDNKKEILNAEKVIFPGVGEAGSAMKYLREKGLDELLKSLKQPVLGICLGQQLMCLHSEEGNTNCMGIFNCSVKLFPNSEIVPHMGWNSLEKLNSEIFNEVCINPDVYFVHSYYCEISEFTVAQCNYILPFAAAMQKNNFFATQFHPEKSGLIGEKILFNFLKL
jgi:imidazole glycerol-phosphate synthase subunit HisH